MYHKPWAHKGILAIMVAQYVTGVLTQEALDALPEILNTLYINLLHRKITGIS